MSHRYTLTALAVASLFTHTAQAATTPEEGTVVVTATRQFQRVNELLADVSVIERAQIEQAGQSTLLELLSQQTGLQMSSDGGPGASGSIFMRGANGGHTLVLVDGIRVNSASNGAAAFEVLPVSQIERIEILRGPAGALYGSDAIGGVIQIFTRKGEGAPRVEASAGIGSNFTSEGTAGISGASGDWHYSLRAGRSHTRGFDANGKPADRDGFDQNHLNASTSLKVAGGGEVGGTFSWSDAVNRVDMGTNFDSHINKNSEILGAYWRQPITAEWTSLLRVGTSRQRMDTVDSLNPQLLRTRNNQFVWQNDIKLPVGKALVAYEYLKEGVDNILSPLVMDSRQTRSLLAGWTGGFGSHRFQINGRRDDNSQYGGRNTGAASYGYLLNDALRVYASAGTAFKAPTFNDLYYPYFCDPLWGCFGGNTNLRPERARNREAGFIWETGLQRASLVHFDNRVSDLIVWGNQPFNVGNASLKGTTATYDFTLGAWAAGIAYTQQRARDADTGLALIRRADRQLTGRLSTQVGAWRFGGDLLMVGARDDTDFNLGARVRLGAYGLLGAFVQYQFMPEWSVEVRGNNLGDKQYTNAVGINTPGASVFASLRYAPK